MTFTPGVLMCIVQSTQSTQNTANNQTNLQCWLGFSLADSLIESASHHLTDSGILIHWFKSVVKFPQAKKAKEQQKIKRVTGKERI